MIFKFQSNQSKRISVILDLNNLQFTSEQSGVCCMRQYNTKIYNKVLQIYSQILQLNIQAQIKSKYSNKYSMIFINFDQALQSSENTSMNMSYLSPPSRVTKIKLSKGQIYQKIDDKHHRYIFAKTPYQTFEIQSIKQIKQYLSKKAPYMNYTDQLILRFSYSGNFLISEIIKKIKLYTDWHENQMITALHKNGREILQYGHVYSYGRDYDYCPVIYVKVNQTDLKKYSPEDYFNAIHALLQPLEAYMLVPGVIQKWNLILDFDKKKTSFSNLELISNAGSKIMHAYPYRLKRLLFVNSIAQNDSIKNNILSVVQTPDEDLEILSVNNWSQLSPLIPQQERQKKFGGSLPNLCEYWPIHTTNKHDQSSQADSEQQYKTVMNDAIYFEQQKQPFCSCGSGKCDIY